MRDQAVLNNQRSTNYQRIAQAIDYIQLHFKSQPSLDEIARAIGLSPFHFQRLFSDWAGVSPKQFMQFLSLEYAKDLLQKAPINLLDVAYATGLSGTGRLHDLFVKIEGMTPGEFKNGGANLCINYDFTDSPFGKLLIASTAKGICHLFFSEGEGSALDELQRRFPNAHFQHTSDPLQQAAQSVFQQDWRQLPQVKLHLKGTQFQLKVWQALLSIPLGQVVSYGALARQIDKPKAARAVGTAIGSNPVAFLIPCHRVITASGAFGGYLWGETRKRAITGWEAAKLTPADMENLKSHL